ncbi:MAG TPA: condensation domain-containing protein [Blastocatellia bacterium]|nr:condensation domain-containing protein [Blastocatellia bacterium]
MSTSDRRLVPDLEPLNLVELLRHRAAAQAERAGYTFLADARTPAACMTYSELDRRARAIGAWLQSRRAADERVLLLFPSGIDYIAAFFGCLYARAVAVPAYPPRSNRRLGRIEAIIENASPAIILTASRLLPQIQWLREAGAGRKAAICAVDAIEDEWADTWRRPSVAGHTLAFLQYTSGSTATPKGVMVTHENLLDNERLIKHAFRQTEASIIVCWLPLFHDMGLIGSVLQTLYAGARCILLSPTTFLQNPSAWLETISRYRATTSGGPDFAYALCSRKVSAEQREAIDLSTWETAYCGAEPIRKQTLDQFAAAFSPCGFRPTAFHPCYGLAEATLFVSGSQSGGGPTIKSVRGEALKRNRLEPAAAEDADARHLVSCGESGAGGRIRIVDPLSLTECPTGHVGEVWVAGASVAAGYWNLPDESRRTFKAYLADSGAGPFLRTGDLGVIEDGELYVTGRSKDLIIIRGRNHYPQDIEFTVERCHPAARPGGGAAFSVEVGGEERLVIVQEIERQYQEADLHEVAEAIRGAVTEAHEVQAHAVVLSKPGSVPKTSSGKVQRSACREAFLAGALNAIESSLVTEPGDLPVESDQPTVSREELLALDSEPQRRLRLERHLQSVVARLLGLAPGQLPLQQPLMRLGVDSLKAMELQNEIETGLKIFLPMSAFLQEESISRLALLAAAELTRPVDEPPSEPAAPANEEADFPPSFGQQRLWFLDQLTPGNPAYNIAVAFRLVGSLNRFALEQAVREIAFRHSALRTVFRERQGQLAQVIQPAAQIGLPLVDMGSVAAGKADELAAAEARRPFDLKQGPLLRVRLLRSSADESLLLLTLHHIISDAWSLGVLLDELAALYRAYLAGNASPLAPLPVQYADFALWQRRQLRGDLLRSQLAYWQQQFARPAAELELPADRPRPRRSVSPAAFEKLTLTKELSDEIRRLARKEGSTLFMALLAGFSVVLHHYTAQSDITVGSPIAGRNRAEFERLIGFFVNTLVLRVDLSGNPTFRQLLGRVRDVALQAYAHQDLPFERLVAAIAPERTVNHSPLYRVWFGLHAGALPTVKLPAATLTPLETVSQAAKVDLAVHFVDGAAGISGNFEYNGDLFEAGTIADLCESFRAVLERATRQPGLSLRALDEHLRMAGRHYQSRVAAKYESALHQQLKQVRRRVVSS